MNKSPCSTRAAERRSSSLRELRPSLHWKGLLFIASASRLYWLCPLKGTGNCSSCYCCQLISGDVADTTAKYPSLSHGLRVSDYFVLVTKKRQLCLQLSPISVQILELWIPQTTEIVVLKCWMQQELQATMQQCPQFHCLVKSIRTFCQSWDLSLSFLNLMFSRLSRGPSGPNHWCHCSLLSDLS